MIQIDSNGFIKCLKFDEQEYLFNGKGPKICGCTDNGLDAAVDVTELDECIVLRVSLTNKTENEIFPKKVSVYLGVDCYMDRFPDWSKKLFPTLLRCERTHFYGYFMSPDNDILGIACPEPLPSYSILYNGGGHRVDSVELDIFNPDTQVERCSDCVKSIRPNETIERNIYLFPVKCLDEFENIAKKYTGAFCACAQKYTVEFGEKINIYADENVKIDIVSPSGKHLLNGATAEEYGIYTLHCTKNGKMRELKVYCRREWDFYLKSAASEALEIPQKATTHCESWYGLFSGYLAAKHYHNESNDNLIEEKFNEIMPLMFDFKAGKPIVSPYRIQNISILISLLTDRYESNPEKYSDSLEIANKFADYLMSQQEKDGGYYQQGKVNFTSVIYSAKSMLELAIEEKKHAEYAARSDIHFKSAKAAVDNLVDLRDNIGTEGEMTFEDGMIACSALQIAFFALLTDSDKDKYIHAAEYMMTKHMCLEQNMIPDCRMRGGSLRFWEAQYDVLCTPNMMSSPHGWTAWTLYSKYYLYLLTGKEKYLIEFMDGMGACVQLITLDGKLMWGFVCDPCIHASFFVKDKKLCNGYSGKNEKRIIGETYLDMISGWYRHEKQVPTGGHLNSNLTTVNFIKKVDNQGGCCDNDVHEIFKCMEETVLKKAFLHQCDDGEYHCYGCQLKNNKLVFNNDVDELVYCIKKPVTFNIDGEAIDFNKRGVSIYKIK